MIVRPLTAADLPWVLELARSRRARLLAHAPRFWRPSRDAEERLAGWLRFQIDSAETLSIRTRSGFLLGQESDDGRTLVDDMAVASAAAWTSDGRVLLREAEAIGRPVRFVSPVMELERAGAARAMGWTVEETWWHLDLPAVNGPGTDDHDLSVDGADGRLVPAPPVYDPGGPVLVVTRADDQRALELIEHRAARAGATVSVAVAAPDDERLAGLLRERRYIRTTDFYATM